MEIQQINSIESAKATVNNNTGVLLFFSTTKCSLGEALEPKVYKLLQEKFPKISFYFIDINFSPDVAAHFNVFVEPTLLVYFEGKETIRKSRTIGIDELSEKISRIYSILFN